MEIIGRVEKVKLTDFDRLTLEAKIDTGAYTSSLHCHNIRLEKKDGKSYLFFSLLDPSHKKYEEKEFCLEEFSQTNVRSSNGQVEPRFIIKTCIRVGRSNYKTEFTLTDRSDMRYPILIGRKLLSKRFLVDCSQKYLIPIPKKSS